MHSISCFVPHNPRLDAIENGILERAVHIFFILTATQTVGFFVYLLKTDEIHAHWVSEDVAWYIGLELIPSWIIAAVFYPMAYWIGRLLRWMVDSYNY
jgi:hypothetical protein